MQWSECTKNKAGIVLKKEVKECSVEVTRIKLKIRTVKVMCSYAPQTGCTQDKKDAF